MMKTTCPSDILKMKFVYRVPYSRAELEQKLAGAMLDIEEVREEYEKEIRNYDERQSTITPDGG